MVSAACSTQKLALGRAGSPGDGASRARQATARMSGTFSRCPQTMAGSPSVSSLVTALASSGRIV
ncbi:MAG TPA: hypothetical protein VG268_02815 [Streptosporangiaceae bacterium]|jgi:hypothetical protein|nr:hypothetical protein [Streptosporangiaceae bacterium]